MWYRLIVVTVSNKPPYVTGAFFINYRAVKERNIIVFLYVTRIKNRKTTI